MAFEDVKEEVLEYWTPIAVGDSIEGHVFVIKNDKYGSSRIVLDMGTDEDGNIMTTTLPGHAHLQRFIKNINIGDYIRVIAVQFIPSKEENKADTIFYKVQKDSKKSKLY